LKPTELHQRVPFFIGSTRMVEKVESMIECFPDQDDA
ncbi:MAG: fructose-bisphosphatase class I, partial [Vibrio sp.]